MGEGGKDLRRHIKSIVLFLDKRHAIARAKNAQPLNVSSSPTPVLPSNSRVSKSGRCGLLLEQSFMTEDEMEADLRGAVSRFRTRLGGEFLVIRHPVAAASNL